MERVLLDTNILCGAILGNGVNRKLLQLARTQTAFKPVISEVVIVEFLAKCRSGLTKKKIIIPEDVIDRFFYVLAPMLDHENIERVAIGREIYVDYLTYYKASIQEFLYDFKETLTNKINIFFHNIMSSRKNYAFFRKSFGNRIFEPFFSYIYREITHLRETWTTVNV